MPGRKKGKETARSRSAGAATKPRTQKAVAVLSETDHAAFDLICACDGADIVEINEAGRALLGYTGTGSPVGAPFSQFVASKEQKKLAKSLASLTKTKKPN